jgi:hypothetical protein
MELPGLGIFTMDPDGYAGEPGSDPSRVSFQNNPSSGDSSGLIQFIAEQTGKMKALAAADLSSHLEIAKQFLNIGKPFLFDGIGSLVKTRTGELNFTPGVLLPEVAVRAESKSDETVEDKQGYRDIFYGRSRNRGTRKALTVLLVCAGVGLAVAGGYTVYKRSSQDSPSFQPATSLQAPADPGPEQAVVDTVQSPPIEKSPSSASATASRNRKFILEKAKAERAFLRYNRLKSFQWKVEMETSDSVLYTLFVRIPSSAMDTTRIVDSLTRMNGRPVHIEE